MRDRAPQRRWERRPAAAPAAALVLAAAALLPAAPATGGLPGSESGAFADVAVGARALGMGRAGSLFTNDAWATYWNPANLFHLEHTELAVDHADLFGLDLARHTAVAFAWRRQPRRNVMRGGRLVEVPRAEGRMGWGVSLGVTTVDLEPESYTELTPAVSAAGQPWDGIALGGTFRLLSASSDLDQVSALGYAVDLGLTIAWFDRVPLAVTVRNLLSTIVWSNDTTDQLPVELTAAAGYTGLGAVRLLAEAVTASDNLPLRQLRAGAEWSHRSGLLDLRGGLTWHGDRDQDALDLTFGAGSGIAGVHADYAFVGHNDTLGDTHRVSLALRF